MVLVLTRIQKHNEFYWKDGMWSSRIQALYQGFKIRNQTKDELIVEIERELDVYEKQYGGTIQRGIWECNRSLSVR